MHDHDIRRGSQGSNQYQRIDLDDFFDAQRARVAALLEQHAAQLRRRLRAHAHEVAASEAEMDADDRDDSGD